MEQLVDLIIECNIDEVETLNFPRDTRFGLRVESKGVIYSFVITVKSDSDKLLVLGAGKLPEIKKEQFEGRPVFSRISWPFDQSTVYYDDPTRHLENFPLLGGWDLGTMDNWYAEDIAKICKHIANNIYQYKTREESYKNMIFYGSSMGGFTALQLGILVQNSVAVVEMPRLDLHYLGDWPKLKEFIFKGLTDEEIDEKFLHRLNIIDLIKREKYIPDAYIILDCSFKFDFDNHYKDFFDRLYELPYKAHKNKNQIKIRIDGKNQGHRQLNYGNLYRAIENVTVLMDVDHEDRRRLISKNFTYKRLSLSIQESLLKYAAARVDLKTIGENPDVEFLEFPKAGLHKRKANYIKEDNISVTTVVGYNGFAKFKFKCLNDCELRIILRGESMRNSKKEMYPIYIDYRKLVINDKILFNRSRVLWHNKPYVYKVDAKKDEEFEVYLEWMPVGKGSNFSDVYQTVSKNNILKKENRKLQYEIAKLNRENHALNLENKHLSNRQLTFGNIKRILLLIPNKITSFFKN